MSEHYEHGSRLDAAIDRAVRRMLSAEPPADLRRRVLARLDDPPPSAAWWPRWGLATAGVAAVVLAVVMLRPATTPLEPPATQAAASPVATGSVPGVPRVEPDAPIAGSPPAPRVTAETPARTVRIERLPEPPMTDVVFGSPDGRVTAASVEASLAPDTPGEDLTAARPGLPPIIVGEIAIAPLVVPPVAIAPLTTQK